MIYRNFKDKELSLLGFGMMRLPEKDDKTVDQEQVNAMVDLALKSGINYFDTAYMYHDGQSEIAAGIALKNYPRDSFYLATKFPAFDANNVDPKKVFEDQLNKCGVDYFDFYLFHCINEKTIANFLNPEFGVIDYFVEQKRLGRIKHLGFSCHGELANLKEFLDKTKDCVEFCQLEINYLDWTLQNGKEKCELVTSYGIPIWIMEPVRGGRIAKFNDEITAKLRALRPDASTPAWAFRFLQGVDNIGMILSGMSNIEQLKDNLKTFEELKPLNEEELKLIFEIAEYLKDDVPCTGCEYCIGHCPMSIKIPEIIKCYNKMRVAVNDEEIKKLDSLEVKPGDCIGCGACAAVCPQGIDIPSFINKTTELYNK